MSISAQLLSMHSYVGLSVLMVIFVAVSMIGFLIVRKLMPGNLEPSHNNIAGYIFGTMGTIYAVLLGFAILLVWEQYETTETSLAVEAGESVAIFQDLRLYPDSEAAKPVKDSLEVYMKSLVQEEYPAMTKMRRSKATDEAFLGLWQKVGSLSPQSPREQTLYDHLLTDMHNMAKSRAERLHAAGDELPEIVWVALIFGAIVTMGSTFFFCADHVVGHLVLTCLLATVLSSLWFIIIGLDHPFSGWACIKPVYCEKALAFIQSGW